MCVSTRAGAAHRGINDLLEGALPIQEGLALAKGLPGVSKSHSGSLGRILGSWRSTVKNLHACHLSYGSYC
jgi:hypothetical protein